MFQLSAIETSYNCNGCTFVMIIHVEFRAIDSVLRDILLRNYVFALGSISFI